MMIIAIQSSKALTPIVSKYQFLWDGTLCSGVNLHDITPHRI